MYDIEKIPLKDKVIDHYPELDLYEEFSDPEDDLLVRFVILILDNDSEFFKTHKDFKKRAKAAYESLGLKNKDILDFSNWISMRDQPLRMKLQGMIYKMFMLLDNTNYSTWFALYARYQEMLAYILLSLDPNDEKYDEKNARKDKATENLPKVQKQLESYEKLIFGSSEIKTIVTKEVAKIISWPERMAINMEDRPGG